MEVTEVKELAVVPYEKMDVMGNELVVSNTGQITLSLSRESFKKRKIGQLVMTAKGQLVYEKHVNEEKHLFRKFNAWGFHYIVLEDLHPEAWLRVISDKKKYAIKVKDARDVAQFLHFKDQGFERQAFIPLSFFKQAELTNA
jgi:hypothetical protein